MNGFIIIDKPAGITSHDVVARVRRITGQKKIGHCGTLDPLATGVLVLALGEATKLVEYFLGCDKVYEARANLGSVSDTYDADGDVLKITDKKPSKSTIEHILKKNFTGSLMQTPPIHSAIKINGQRAYKMARKGIEFQILARRIKIHTLDLLNYEWPELDLRVFCSKGTYIRSLVHDIGQDLKCGAYLAALSRTRVAHFDISDSVTLENLKLDFQTYILPIKEVVSHLSRIVLSDPEYAGLRDGGIIENVHGSPKAPVFAYHNGEISGVLEFPQDGRLLKFRKKLNIL